MRPTHDSLAAKIEDMSMKVPEAGCWLWMYCVLPKGYGVLSHKGVAFRAHRAAYLAFKGDIPEGMHVLHNCDVASCVNPAHLYLGDDKQNGTDKAKRGRAASKRGELNGRAKLTEEQVAEIRKSHESLFVLARRYGVSKVTIKKIHYNISWKK